MLHSIWPWLVSGNYLMAFLVGGAMIVIGMKYDSMNSKFNHLVGKVFFCLTLFWLVSCYSLVLATPASSVKEYYDCKKISSTCFVCQDEDGKEVMLYLSNKKP